MDEETKKEFEEVQASTFGGGGGAANAASQIQNFDLAGFLSGSLVLRRVRRSETACKRRNTRINAKAPISAIVSGLYTHSSAPGGHI